MIKDKLHTISDEDAISAALLLLKCDTPYNYTFTKITRVPFNVEDGVDSEESVNVYFAAIVTHEAYRSAGWKDQDVCVQLIESDRYHNYPYFSGSQRDKGESLKHLCLANQVEAIEFLQLKKLL